MENQELKFKTNLNCGGCVSKVQADLDNAVGISNWNVDISNADKILTVTVNGITEKEIIAIITSKGFKAESFG
ncbi:MAG: cation transporter [Cyclobacteriaceae bacterium]|nr:cation transporter [Cyclobacteriaceae bacterium]